MVTGQQIVDTARTVLGFSYGWGQEDNPGFDCSGLCQWVYARNGVAIPRTSQEQAQAGSPVAYSDLQPGDLVIIYSDASHVALYSGGGNVIQAADYGIPVEEVPLTQAGPYNCARRFILNEQAGNAMPLFGPDLSNNNWNSMGEVAGWLDACFHREGYSWMEHKVSEGNYYSDPYWPAVRDWCAANDIPCIGYHYVTTNDAHSQAQKFLGNGGGSVVMLDFEANSGDINNFWAVVNAFNAAGVSVQLSYFPHWYWQQISSPDLSGVPGLISSAYYGRNSYGSVEYAMAGGDTGSGWNSYGGATPVIWQFSDGALIDGKSVDVNAFKGTIDQLRALLTGAPVTPTPSTNPPAVTKPTGEPAQISELWDQELTRWDMLGGHTVVEALAVIGQTLGIPGFTPPKGN